jgi:hypothetical protein
MAAVGLSSDATLAPTSWLPTSAARCGCPFDYIHGI